MRYIQRNGGGKLTGHFANPQTYAQEEAPDDHPDILAWMAEREAFRLADHNAASNERLRTLEARVAVLEATAEVMRQQLATLLEMDGRLAEVERKTALMP